MLAGNHLRSASAEALGSILALGWLPALLSLDLSDNPLGPSGVRGLAKGLPSPADALPLQSLNLARTKAGPMGVAALGEALKAKKVASLGSLDLEGNAMRPGGFKHLAAAVREMAVPHLRVLNLKRNFLTHVSRQHRDFAPLNDFLSTSGLRELEELDLSDNVLFD
uniref:Uncharacterized protein n=1 Tax=Chromera velia CCMP2878 TaxID=1169474 RepID=A0A0G4HVX8_9ALVE|eukprot:Cvel_8922.t1-p1 / transcript=Cvel_8922.t1 / gene=Cvel_8922 / organism=Chromera_velia_CCMP2878 / gene_product=hypothetical protein / transcript_product=hypothetical protein / location=Cvel_scaffold502:38215-38709(+) / protein_length=165 / sequence_SO=supercontig / SO=protein_coding / is_pseudo=false